MSNRETAGAICADWWRQTLCGDDTAARLTRARLRRCTTPAEALTIEGVHDLNRRMREAGLRPAADQLALVATALAHVDDSGAQTLASAFGRRESRRGPCALSSSRFHALVRTTDKAQLIGPLCRAVAIVRRRPIDVRALAADLFDWNERARNSWCFQYFGGGYADPEPLYREMGE